MATQDHVHWQVEVGGILAQIHLLQLRVCHIERIHQAQQIVCTINPAIFGLFEHQHQDVAVSTELFIFNVRYFVDGILASEERGIRFDRAFPKIGWWPLRFKRAHKILLQL